MDEPETTRPALHRRVLSELGILALIKSPFDVKLLCLQRFTRLFAYGASTLILVAYLRELGHSRARSGLFMTLTLIGDVLLSFLLTLVADSVGRKAILSLGAVLMAGSGVVFATASNYWILLAAAVVGVISPAGNEIGPFRAIEESVVAHLTLAEERSDVYAWYNLIGSAGAALGMMACGWAVDGVMSKWGWTFIQAYRATFAAYAAFGLVKLLFTLCLSSKVEAESKKRPASGEADERTALLDAENGATTAARAKKSFVRSLLPDISAESRRVTVMLCMLFALDSFGSGLAPMSWVTYYFRTRFDLDEGKLGSIFFTTNIIAGISVIVASSISKRLGNVKTMVFTHLPSAVFLALIPLPSNPKLAVTFLVLRSCMQSMDSAPKSAFLSTILLPEERTSVMGAVNVVKTTAQSLGPLITGLLAGNGLFWVSFVCAGSFKATYDLGLLAVFKGYERRQS
ncbi:hypothetical protein K4F52_004404 [Lecanicillium sp. MT-2017a]|nr:hypothetical protein K4F52_004404 [Lecanicillium sp. MT-2017a]